MPLAPRLVVKRMTGPPRLLLFVVTDVVAVVIAPVESYARTVSVWGPLRYSALFHGSVKSGGFVTAINAPSTR